MSASTTEYDVVILPPPALSRYAIKLSRQIAGRFGSPLILDEQQALPHISLYHVAVARPRLPEVQAALARIAAQTAPGSLQVSGIRSYRQFHSLAIELSKPRWLRRLYLRIIHRLNPLRDHQFDNERVWNAARLSPSQRSFIARYGTPLIGHHFIPHITVAVVKDSSQLEAAAALIKPSLTSFTARWLYLCVQGQHHTCRRIVSAYELKAETPEPILRLRRTAPQR